MKLPWRGEALGFIQNQYTLCWHTCSNKLKSSDFWAHLRWDKEKGPIPVRKQKVSIRTCLEQCRHQWKNGAMNTSLPTVNPGVFCSTSPQSFYTLVSGLLGFKVADKKVWTWTTKAWCIRNAHEPLLKNSDLSDKLRRSRNWKDTLLLKSKLRNVAGDKFSRSNGFINYYCY